MNNNIFLAVILSIGIMLGFQYLWVKPQAQHVHSQQLAQQVDAIKTETPLDTAQTLRDRALILKDGPRVTIATAELSGSINLKGARFDDLSLNQYRETEDPASPAIILLSPSGSDKPHLSYYAEFDWLADPAAPIPVPNADTLWMTDGKQVSTDHPVKLTWNNGQGQIFNRLIAVDAHQMFTVTDSVINNGNAAIKLYPSGIIARHGVPPTVGRAAVHEGGLGVLGGTLDEYKYKKLVDDGKQVTESTGGWLGITDKYWLMAMIPPQNEKLTAEFSYNRGNADTPAMGFFQSDYRGAPLSVDAHGSVQQVTHLFAGAKRIKLLDAYAQQYQIPHFDKAIDFGWFYFLTRPFLYLLALLANHVGSIGIAILLFTVLLKLATLPLSLKSYHSMARMKTLQPEVKRIQERYADDKVKQSQEMMELYKREKANPMSGCLPTVIQIPIFFALYKVLYVNIEMRHAPFFGWITDMSAPDPTSWTNIFGLAPWHVPDQIVINLGLFPLYLPPAVHIGLWPVLMGISMFLQQKMSPQPPDKSQARVFMFMPLFFTYLLSNMPAGLVIYWTWSNLLGIAQQWFIMSRDAKRKIA